MLTQSLEFQKEKTQNPSLQHLSQTMIALIFVLIVLTLILIIDIATIHCYMQSLCKSSNNNTNHTASVLVQEEAEEEEEKISAVQDRLRFLKFKSSNRPSPFTSTPPMFDRTFEKLNAMLRPKKPIHTAKRPYPFTSAPWEHVRLAVFSKQSIVSH